MSLASSTASRPVRTSAPHARFRTDIQALRALAILAVALNHLWPTRVPGGYIGVDVFFVISGFLITSHLMREIAETGHIRLGTFYARRIRRLLPAALTVLAVSTLLVTIFLPYPRWERNALEIGASAAYGENWLLAGMAVNYSALNDAASVAQHYWSLSVEEQFYFVWPVLMIIAAIVGTRCFGNTARAIAIVLVVVGATSLFASIVFTASSPSQAYFVTFTRAWEFATGGLVALLATRVLLSRTIAELVALVGFVSIIVVAFLYGANTSFPSAAALVPVLGTAMIIFAGAPGHLMRHTRLTASRPVQWVGGVSYSLYLWHWPLIVIAPFALRSELTFLHRLGVLVFALLFAGLTKVFIEDRGQRWQWWAGSVRRSVLGMTIGVVAVALGASALLLAYHARAAANSPEAAVAVGSCVGPNAMANSESCPDKFGPPESSVMTARNEYFYTPPECGTFLDILVYADKHTTLRCRFTSGEPTERVWLVGDSHAQQWQGAVFDLARERGWEVTTSYYGGCPAADVSFVGFRSPWGPAEADRCRSWSRGLSDAIVDAAPDIVFTAMAARLQLVDDGTQQPPADQFADGLLRDWKRWTAAGAHVVALADPPFNGEVRSPDCVALNAGDPLACARPRSQAQPLDPLVVAAGRAGDLRVTLVDLTDRFCDDATCYAVIGGVPVYYDADHLNLEFVRMLAPAVGAAADQSARRPPQ